MSEVHCGVVLHIISQFPHSDWDIEMVNRDLWDKITASWIMKQWNVIEEGD